MFLAFLLAVQDVHVGIYFTKTPTKLATQWNPFQQDARPDLVVTRNMDSHLTCDTEPID